MLEWLTFCWLLGHRWRVARDTPTQAPLYRMRVCLRCHHFEIAKTPWLHPVEKRAAR